MKKITSIFLLVYSVFAHAQDPLLTGTIFGSPAVDYSTGAVSTTANQPSAAFDNNVNTFYASYDRHYTYVALDLGTQHIITRVGWSPRNESLGRNRVILGTFEGANSPDFLDAIPLYVIDQAGTLGTISTADVNCSRGFRYVRYVGPNDARCNIAEVQFFGHPGEGDDSNLYRPTNLPCITIHTVNSQDPYDKVNYIRGYVTLLDADGSVTSDSLGLRFRGNASMGFEKKPYRMKLDTKTNVFGSPAQDKNWCLLSNYGDKTLMRNILAMHTSQIFGMEYTPWMIPVDLFVNGEYKGCYQLADKIGVDKNKLNIAKTDFFWEIDAYANQEPAGTWFDSNRRNPVTIHNPEDEVLDSLRQNVINAFNSMESIVYSSYYANATTGWRSKLDANSFLSHFLIGEFSGNTDTYWSVYQYKREDDPLVYTGPIWDFDLAFENDSRTYPICNKTDYIYRSGGSCAGDMRTFVNRIVISDTNTKDEMLTLWSEARYNGLTETEFHAFIDSIATLIDASQRLNFMRWNILNSRVHMNPKTYGSYTGEVNNVKTYVRNRIAWMDRKLGFTWQDHPQPTGTPTLQSSPAPQKRLENGHILIQHGSRRIDLLGNTHTDLRCTTHTDLRAHPIR